MHIGFRQSEFDTNNFNLRSDTYYDDKDITNVRAKRMPVPKPSKISLGMSNEPKPKRVVKSSSKSLKKKSKKSKK
jgi:hypothetical protein